MLSRLAKRLLHDPLAHLIVSSRDGRSQRLVLETRLPIEAPNWSRDGQWLIVNADGALHRIRASGEGPLEQIPTGAIGAVSNDHVLSPDGTTIYFTADGRVYAVPVEGGSPRLVSVELPADKALDLYVHGVSPDGATLVCTGLARVGDARTVVCLLASAGGAPTRVGDSLSDADGAEFSPDGGWIYFNAERGAKRPGHSQIFRMRSDGTEVEAITQDDRVNWFPHLSPDGLQLTYLSYEPGTIGHPANVPVEIRLMVTSGSTAFATIPFRGGQGTINTNSWSPDGAAFAYVAYPRRSER